MVTIKAIIIVFIMIIATEGVALDPGRIWTWRNSWNQNPIELSKTNAENTGVTATFFVNPTTELNAGSVDVVFPTGFVVTAAACDATLNVGCTTVITGQLITLIGITLAAGHDTKVVIHGITNPTVSGGYGPFSIITRNY
jgi:hypothetical protein